MSNIKVTDNDEMAWWLARDDDEPLMGAPSVSAGGAAVVPLPDDVGDEPEPGLAMEQQDADELQGFDAPADY